MSEPVRGLHPGGKIEPGDPDFSVRWADVGDLDQLFREARSHGLSAVWTSAAAPYRAAGTKLDRDLVSVVHECGAARRAALVAVPYLVHSPGDEARRSLTARCRAGIVPQAARAVDV